MHLSGENETKIVKIKHSAISTSESNPTKQLFRRRSIFTNKIHQGKKIVCIINHHNTWLICYRILTDVLCRKKNLIYHLYSDGSEFLQGPRYSTSPNKATKSYRNLSKKNKISVVQKEPVYTYLYHNRKMYFFLDDTHTGIRLEVKFLCENYNHEISS